ncbi:hypothetical protein Dimus_021289 [Dionaea muscipula]
MGVEEPPALSLPPLPPSKAPAVVSTSLAPGFRFHPTDQELVSYYLKRKVCGKPIRFDAISETDIYKCEPWDLPEMSRLKSRDNEWYFFGVQDKKYVNGSRVNRATGKGYWKATGNDRPIIHNARMVGMKKTLVFYSGRAPCGKRTNWVMHEYRLTDEEVAKDGVALDAYLLCKILKKSGPGFKPGEQYGPFVEKEWEKDEFGLVPGEDNEDDTLGNDDARVKDSIQSINNSDATCAANSNSDSDSDGGLSRSRGTGQILFLPLCCKVERPEEDPPADPEPFPNYKRARLELDSSHSEISTTNTTQKDTNANSSTLLELLDPVGSKDQRLPPPPPAGPHPQINIIDINVPPSYLKLFEELGNEIYRISVEKESLKIQVMSTRTMINILQSKIEHLSKENEDLKRITQVPA